MTRHHNLEHRRATPEPFTIRGTLPIILNCLGLPEDMNFSAAEDAMSDGRELNHSGIACTVVAWECDMEYDGLPVYTVKTVPLNLAEQTPKADPWVVVGTTTIDGDNDTIAAAFGFVAHYGLYGILQDLDEDGRVLQAGGHNVRIRERDLDPEHGGVVVCDIVRRQSEIDDEALAAATDATAEAFDKVTAAMRAADPCPECGPHGNAGRVLLLESWVDCTTCREGRDPPGVLVTGRDDLQVASWFAEGLPDHATGFSSLASARVDAWNWHDRRP